LENFTVSPVGRLQENLRRRQKGRTARISKKSAAKSERIRKLGMSKTHFSKSGTTMFEKIYLEKNKKEKSKPYAPKHNNDSSCYKVAKSDQ